MSLSQLAGSCKVTISALNELINGKANSMVAGSIGVTISSLQTFIDGGSNSQLAGKMKITNSSLQELRNLIGKEGAIGLIIGLLQK